MAWKKWRGTPAKGRWHAYWKEHDGARTRTRSKALSRDEATATRLLGELQRNRDAAGVGLGAVVGLDALRLRYLAHLKAKNCAPSYLARVGVVLRHLERIHPKLRLPALTADRVDDYQAARLAAGIAAATVRREVGVIKTAVAKGRRFLYQIPDLSGVEKPHAQKAVHLPYTTAQVLGFLATAPPLVAIVLRLGLYTGLRRYEMLALRWADVDLATRTLLLGKGWRTKNHEPRAIPVHPQLAAALGAWKEQQRAAGSLSERVVPWAKTPQALTGRVVYYLRVKCGVPEGALHTLRRTFMTGLKRKNVDTGKAMRMAGQTTEKVAQGYVTLEVEDLRADVGRLDFEPGAAAKDALTAFKPGGE